MITMGYCFIGSATGASNSATCQVEYTEQPPDQLQCNPYTNAELRLECTVVAQPNHTPRLFWFRSRHMQQYQQQQQQQQQEQQQQPGQQSDSESDQWVIERLEASQAGVVIHDQQRTSSTSYSVRSRLVLSNLDSLDSGDYWCRVLLNGDEWTVPSDAVYLREATYYTQLGACSTSGALSKDEGRCADWNNRISTASTGTDSQHPTIPTLILPEEHMTSRPSMVTKPPTSTSRSTTSTSTTDDNIGVHLGATTGGISDSMETATTTKTTVESTQAVNAGVKESEDVTKGHPNPTDEGSWENTRQPQFLLELYIAIAVLVIFGMITAILIPITVCMCFRKRRKIEGKICTT